MRLFTVRRFSYIKVWVLKESDTDQPKVRTSFWIRGPRMIDYLQKAMKPADLLSLIIAPGCTINLNTPNDLEYLP